MRGVEKRDHIRDHDVIISSDSVIYFWDRRVSQVSLFPSVSYINRSMVKPFRLTYLAKVVVATPPLEILTIACLTFFLIAG